MRLATFAASLLLATAALAAPAAAAEVTLRVQHFLPPNSATQIDLLGPWKERLERESNGRIAIEIYPLMQLGGKAPQLYDQARDGVVDVVWTLPGYSAGRFPIASVFELPFMAGNATTNSQAVQEFGELYLAEEFGEVHPLLWHAHGPGEIHVREKEIRRMEDMAGLKIRAPSRLIGEALDALGATSVFMPVPQVPEQISKGVIDGAVLPFEVTRSLKIPELVKSHTVLGGPRGLYTAVFFLGMNKAVWDGLPDDLKAIVNAAGGVPEAERIGALWDQREKEGLQEAIDAGNTIIYLDAAETQRWVEKTQPVTDKWIADMNAAGHDGAKYLAEALRLIDKYSPQ